MALVAAATWAVATILFSRVGTSVPPLELNLYKNLIAIVLLGLSMLALGQAMTVPQGQAMLLLALSGIIGISLGDTAYLAALRHLGPRRTLLLETLAPPLAAVLALVALDETLGVVAWLGIVVTGAGIAWVITERVPDPSAEKGQEPLATASDDGGFQRKVALGLIFGVVAAVAQAIGVVLSRAALTRTEVTPLWSAELRLLAGVLGIVLWRLAVLGVERATRGQRPAAARPPAFRIRHSVPLWSTIVLATILGTYLGIWLQQLALAHTEAGIAQTLMSTSPVFVLPLALLLGDRVSVRAALGACIAVVGVALLLLP